MSEQSNPIVERVQAWADREIDRVAEELRTRGWGFVAIVLARYAELDAETGGAPSSAGICISDHRVLPGFGNFASALHRLGDEVELRYRQSGERRETFNAELRTIVSEPVPGVGIDPGWLVKDFHVLYRAAHRLAEACNGRGDGKPYGPLKDLERQLDRLKPAFEMTETMRREGVKGN